jgi:hypothetical protein
VRTTFDIYVFIFKQTTGNNKIHCDSLI